MPDIDLDTLGQTQLLELLHRLQTEENSLEKECKQLQTEATSLGREVEHVLMDGNGVESRKQREEERATEEEQERVGERMRVLTKALENIPGLADYDETLRMIASETKELYGARVLMQGLVSRPHLREGVREAKEKGKTNPRGRVDTSYEGYGGLDGWEKSGDNEKNKVKSVKANEGGEKKVTEKTEDLLKGISF